MASNRAITAAAFVWIGLATAAYGQKPFDNPFGEPKRFPSVSRDLIDDTQLDGQADENPFGGDGSQKTEVDDDPFGPPAKESSSATKKQVKTPRPAEPERPPSSNERVREALHAPTRMEFVQMPLLDAVAYLKDFHGIEIQLDTRKLEDAGVGSETPVNLNVDGIPLSSALRLLLDNFDLAYVVTNDVLLITTESAANAMTEMRVYDVGEVIGPEANADEVAKMLALISSPTHTLVPGGVGGGMGGMGGGMVDQSFASNLRIVPFRNLLIIQASQREHEKFSELFEDMKHKLKAGR